MVCTSNERAGYSMNEPRLGRLRGPGHDASHVEPIELFYDVVYVLAVTQLTRHLLDDLSPRGAIDIVWPYPRARDVLDAKHGLGIPVRAVHDRLHRPIR
jgi:Bacterial low temperature requirement A protein (LtrA)